MKNFNQYLPTILIIILFIVGYIGYNKVVSNQSANRAIFERTRKEIEQSREIYLKEIKSLKTAVQSQDSLIQKYDEKLFYIQKQSDAIYHKYDNLPDIYLPEL